MTQPSTNKTTDIKPAQVLDGLQFAGFPAAIWDQNCHLLACNEFYGQFAGRPPSELIGRSLAELFGQAAWQACAAWFEAAQQGKAVEHDTLMAPPPSSLSGEVVTDARWLRVKLAPMFDATGAVQAILCTVIDIDQRMREQERKQQAAQDSEQRVLRMLTSIDLPIARWDRQARLLFCNQPFIQWTGAPEGDLLGQALLDLFGTEVWRIAQPAFEQAFAGRPAIYTRLVARDQGQHWTRVSVFPDVEPDGSVNAVYSVAFQIDNEMRSIEALEESRRRLDAFTANIPYPLTYFDRDFVYRFVNKAFAARHRLHPDQVIGRKVEDVRGAAIWAEHWPLVQGALQGQETQYERIVHLADGGERWMRSSYTPDIDDTGHVRGIYSVSVDIHELKMAQQALRQSVDRDALTEVYNRRYLMDRLDDLCAAAEAQPFTLFFVDLDGFKQINDSAGHSAGDAMLRAIAQRLCALTGENEVVARFGGDEFVLLSFSREPVLVAGLAERIVAAASMPVLFEHHVLRISASVGVAMAPEHANNPNTLMRAADEAMYVAKRKGKNAWSLATPPVMPVAQAAA